MFVYKKKSSDSSTGNSGTGKSQCDDVGFIHSWDKHPLTSPSMPSDAESGKKSARSSQSSSSTQAFEPKKTPVHFHLPKHAKSSSSSKSATYSKPFEDEGGTFSTSNKSAVPQEERHRPYEEYDSHTRSSFKKSPFDLNPQENTPFNPLHHASKIGKSDAPKTRYNRSFKHSQKDMGAPQSDLPETHHNDENPPTNHDGIDRESMPDFSQGWGQQTRFDADALSRDISLLNPAKDRVDRDGYDDFARTPYDAYYSPYHGTKSNPTSGDFSKESTFPSKPHNDPQSEEDFAASIEEENFARTDQTTRTPFSDKSSTHNPTHLRNSQKSFADSTSHQLHDAKQERSFLDEHYESPEAQRAKQLLSDPPERSFLYPDYIAPEAYAAARKLVNPGNNSRSFFHQRSEYFNTEQPASNHLIDLKQLLRDFEQSGKPPKTYVYNDGKDIPTIATGLALGKRHEKHEGFVRGVIAEALFSDILNKRERLKEADKTIDEWRAEMGNKTPLITQEQANKLEEITIKHKKNALHETEPKINKHMIDNVLKPHQVAVLISLKFNGVMGQNLAGYINAGDMEGAYREIREKSCGERALKHDEARKTVVGLQKRREQEAHLFRTGERITDEQATALMLQNRSNQPFLKALNLVEKLAKGIKPEIKEWVEKVTGSGKSTTPQDAPGL